MYSAGAVITPSTSYFSMSDTHSLHLRHNIVAVSIGHIFVSLQFCYLYFTSVDLSHIPDVSYYLTYLLYFFLLKAIPDVEWRLLQYDVIFALFVSPHWRVTSVTMSRLNWAREALQRNDSVSYVIVDVSSRSNYWMPRLRCASFVTWAVTSVRDYFILHPLVINLCNLRVNVCDL